VSGCQAVVGNNKFLAFSSLLLEILVLLVLENYVPSLLVENHLADIPWSGQQLSYTTLRIKKMILSIDDTLPNDISYTDIIKDVLTR